MDQNPPGFANEDEEATYCLSLLRDGDRQQKIVARERLSQIFEQRGLLDEAAQCLESNIREGIRDPRVYQRLAGVYRRQGRHELADEVLLEARRLAERLQRGSQSGRRGGPGRPARGVPPPAPGLQDTTRNLPQSPGSEAPTISARVAPAPAQPGPAGAPGGEFALDQPGDFGGPPRPGSGGMQPGGQAPVPAGPPPARPWWLSPAMVVLLILLCGPFGLAMMWVRGNYPEKARKTAVGVWAGLMVLLSAAAAVTIQAQVRSAIGTTPLPGMTGLPGVPAGAVPPTPISFPPATGAQPGTPKPGLQFGPAPSPPAVTGNQLGTPTGTTILPPGASPVAAAPSPAPGAPAAKPTNGAEPAAKPSASGEKVRVFNTGGTGANMRERPGSTAPVVKTVEDGAELTIIGADQQMDGRGWRNVRDDDGKTGWIVAEFLESVP